MKAILNQYNVLIGNISFAMELGTGRLFVVLLAQGSIAFQSHVLRRRTRLHNGRCRQFGSKVAQRMEGKFRALLFRQSEPK